MTKLADMFEVDYTRPLNELNSVSIAELAQFTDIVPNSDFPISSAYDQLRDEWRYEIDEEHALYYVDFKSARAVFKDGSTLQFKRK